MKMGSKLSLRLFKRHFIRMITIILIVVVSVGFMSGIGEIYNKIEVSVNNQYLDYNMSDFYVKSSRTTGFTKTEKEYLTQTFGAENTESLFCYELENDGEVTRIYNLDLENNDINKLELLEGRFPENSNEIVVERKTNKIKKHKVGDVVKVAGRDLTITGIVYNPLMTIVLGEPSFAFSEKDLSEVYYIHSANPFMINDMYITITDRELFDTYSTDYEEYVAQTKENILSDLGEDNVSVLSLYENKGLYSLYSYAKKVAEISVIFVIFFLLVTVLVVYSTMKRLFDEERGQLACQKTLGFTDWDITKRYVFFIFVTAIIGGLIAFPVGYGLTAMLYNAFNIQYRMLPLPYTLNFSYYGITLAIIILGAVITTIISGRSVVKHKPAVLLQPKAPKIGKKTFLEYIPFIWQKLAFKYKSTLRNVFLFKSRFFMTVVSVLGSAVLVFAGFGLMDNALKIDGAESLVSISFVLVGFSAALCALVIYNLTNINVSEREREIATLMVLGYQDREVTGYIFREIYIMCLISAILGIPVGMLFIHFAFGFIDFGSLANVNWWSYVITPILTMFFGFLSTRLLYKKITRIDMNRSLKSLE